MTVETPRQPFSWGLRPSGPIHRLARDHKINWNRPAAKKSLRLRRALALLVPRAQSISRRRSLSPFRRLIFQQSDGLPGTSSDARPAEDACDAACSGMRTENGRQEKAREGRETAGEAQLTAVVSRKQPRSLTIHGKSHVECCRIKQQSRAWRDGLVAVHDLTLHTVIDAGSIWRVSSSESRREKLMSILRSQFWR